MRECGSSFWNCFGICKRGREFKSAITVCVLAAPCANYLTSPLDGSKLSTVKLCVVIHWNIKRKQKAYNNASNLAVFRFNFSPHLLFIEISDWRMSTRQIPRDAQVIQAILKDMGITEYEPRVVNQLLEFVYSKSFPPRVLYPFRR